jgi:hypothetical protein
MRARLPSPHELSGLPELSRDALRQHNVFERGAWACRGRAESRERMIDLILVAVTVVFFVIALEYVEGCERV